MMGEATKRDSRDLRHARKAFRRHGGILRMADALREGIHRRTLYAMRDAGQIEALARGRDLLGELGVDLAASDVEVVGDEWGRTVLAWQTLDGIRSPLSAGVSFGGDGALTWANGYLGAVERGPDYPRAGTTAGFERLHPVGRMAEPDDVARLVAFLGSPDAANVTGAFYVTDGGFTAQ